MAPATIQDIEERAARLQKNLLIRRPSMHKPGTYAYYYRASPEAYRPISDQITDRPQNYYIGRHNFLCLQLRTQENKRTYQRIAKRPWDRLVQQGIEVEFQLVSPQGEECPGHIRWHEPLLQRIEEVRDVAANQLMVEAEIHIAEQIEQVERPRQVDEATQVIQAAQDTQAGQVEETDHQEGGRRNTDAILDTGIEIDPIQPARTEQGPTEARPA